MVFCSSGRAGPTLAIRPGGRGDVTETHVAWKTPAVLPLPSGPRQFHVVLPFIRVRDDSIPPPNADEVGWTARLALPEVILRAAGGREVTLGDLQELGMQAGLNALIVGNYLTYLGRPAEEDVAMLTELSMPIGSLSKVL